MAVPSSVAIEDLKIFESDQECVNLFGQEMCEQLGKMQGVVNSLKNNIQSLIEEYESEIQDIDAELASSANMTQAEVDALIDERDQLRKQIQDLQVRLIPMVTNKLSTIDAAVGAKLDGRKRRRVEMTPVQNLLRDDVVRSLFNFYKTQGRLPNMSSSLVDFILDEVDQNAPGLTVPDKLNAVAQLADAAGQSLPGNMTQEDITWWSRNGTMPKDELDDAFAELQEEQEIMAQ